MYIFAGVGNDRCKKVYFCILTYMEVCYENIKLCGSYNRHHRCNQLGADWLLRLQSCLRNLRRCNRIYTCHLCFGRSFRTLHDQSVRKSLCRRLKRKCCLNRYVSRQQFFMPYFSLRVLQILYRSLHFRNLRTGLHG